jgi:hypothetical protein
MLVAAALLSFTPPAPAQSGDVSDIAAYRGADREQRLIEGARREAMLLADRDKWRRLYSDVITSRK